MSSFRKFAVIGIGSFCFGLIYNFTQRHKDYPDIAETEENDYFFNSNGILLNKNGEGFTWKNQKHYEKVCEYVNDYIEKELEKRGMKKVLIHAKRDGEDIPQNYIFVLKKKDGGEKTMVLIPGSGKVVGGLWARSVCINDSLEKGSMLPYVDRALGSPDYKNIVILNPNKNLDDSKQRMSHEAHVIQMWDKFLRNYQNIHFVGHSYAGVSLLFLLKNREKEFTEKVDFVGLTDSVHHYPQYFANVRLNSTQMNWLLNHSRNWASSTKPLDTYLKKMGGVYSYSAGHEKHEYTSYHAMNSVFSFFSKNKK